jgi:hypothetical protein
VEEEDNLIVGPKWWPHTKIGRQPVVM